MKTSPSGIRRPLLRKLYIRTVPPAELERIAAARARHAAAQALLSELAAQHTESPELFDGLSGN